MLQKQIRHRIRAIFQVRSTTNEKLLRSSPSSAGWSRGRISLTARKVGLALVEINILGPLEIVTENEDRILPAPKVRQVLALFLTQANQVVNIDEIIEELWADNPPSSATTTAQTYICHLRKILSHLTSIGRPPQLLTTIGPGYAFHMNDAQSDVEKYRRFHGLGRALIAEGHPDQAASYLRDALQIWRGHPLVNIRLGRLLDAQTTKLKEERAHTLELRIEADLQLGRHRELIAELRSLVLIHPLNEWFHARLIEALGRCGRRREALEAYRSLYDTLYCELGMVPSQEVQELQRAILKDGLANWHIPEQRRVRR